jgi:hypothetical protein
MKNLATLVLKYLAGYRKIYRYMNQRERHPTWVTPTDRQLSQVIGGCLADPVSRLDVTVVSREQLDDPLLEMSVTCQQFPEGTTINTPFPLMDAADTNKEQTQLGIDAAQVALDGLCENCEFRLVLE